MTVLEQLAEVRKYIESTAPFVPVSLVSPLYLKQYLNEIEEALYRLEDLDK
jgi:hypothetical protein